MARSEISRIILVIITSAVLCHGISARAQPAPPQALSSTVPTIPDEVVWQADSQSSAGRNQRLLRGHVELRKLDMVLTADEVDYNEETGDATARGSVHYVNAVRKEDIYAARFDYNLSTEIGMFYKVSGTASSVTQGGTRMLTTNEPFYFQAETAQKIRDHYVIHNGTVTNCRRPRPWWTFHAPVATITPGDSAVLHHAVFWLGRVPLFYAPVYYKSLTRMPRTSGFLTPTVANSSTRGKVVGDTFYWAINRSNELTLSGMYFSRRGPAGQITGRSRPSEKSHFEFSWYGLHDRGIYIGNTLLKQGGETVSFTGRTELPWGFQGVVNVNYLSSYEFRLAFSETFTEAVFSESDSTAFAAKSLSTFFFGAALERHENFQSTSPGDSIVIRKLPSFELDSREHQLLDGPVPLWFLLDSSADLLGRSELVFQTSQLTERFNVFPRFSSKLDWFGFRLIPTIGVHETYYGESQTPGGTLLHQSLNRKAGEASLELIPPSFERVFHGPKIFGDQIKHVIEPKVTYRYVAGVEEFNRVIRFDEIDLLNDTNQVEFSLTNRFYSKRAKTGEVMEFLSLEVKQRRFFDPTFGSALQPGERNIFLSTVDLTPFAFADTPRSYSPVVTVIRVQPRWNYNLEWRNDYDPLRGRIVDSGVSGDVTMKNFNILVGHYEVNSIPLLTPQSNQFHGTIRYGSINKRGWSTAFQVAYDYEKGLIQYANTQVTYNTDCCGISGEWRRFSLGPTRNENLYRLSLSIANVGSFGNMKRQERIY